MKSFIFSLILLFSSSLYAQCVDCNSLEEALKEPAKVKTLKINAYMHESLEEVPPSIGELVNLEILYLTDHEFTTIPSEIGQLKNLKEISFSGSPITAVPEEIFGLTKLKEVLLMNTAMDDAYKKELKALFKEKLPKTMTMIR
ncbi:MAG: hypothetical protein R8P61_06405 [Bacteroidia bacterium]|nr:hypothetical protein [Bacteroidia bacterium]